MQQQKQPRKRKIFHRNNKLAEVIGACQTLQDDSEKIKALLGYINQLKIAAPKYEWIKKETTIKFLTAVNINPKKTHEILAIADSESVDSIVKCFYSFTDSKEGIIEIMSHVTDTVDVLSKNLNVNILPTQILSLLTSLQRLKVVVEGSNIGELVVSGAISSLLEVICNINGHFQNGDKQSDINLDDNLPVFHVRNDGTISKSNSSIPYFLREDKSCEKYEEWDNDYTDAFKLILSMKCALREKMQKEKAIKSDREKYSKVLGLNFLQKSAHLFLLELEFIEKDNEIFPCYHIAHQSFNMGEMSDIVTMWLIILKFSIDYVPKFYKAGTNYCPTKETASKNLSQISKMTSTYLTKVHKSTLKTKMYKQVINSFENESDQIYTYRVLGTTFMKRVTSTEIDVIVKLVELQNFSPYLPRILNIYKDIVEFEDLICLSDLNEEAVMDLLIDISKALHFLHSNQIVHRDVKPANIMIRNFHSHCDQQFVLIDFGLSFSFYKKDGICFDVATNTTVTDAVGTGLFKAPEVNQTTPYDEKIDIYSLGASIIYLRNNNCSGNWHQAIQNIEWKCQEFKELVLRMLNSDPSMRPTAFEITKNLASLQK